MKKTIATILLLALLIGVMAPYTVALAGSYKGDTKYAGWYKVYRTESYLSINNKPESSSNDGVSRIGKAKNGDQVYITDAQAGAGTAKKWGKVTKVKDQKTGTEKSVNGYACMYFLTKDSNTSQVGNSAKVAAKEVSKQAEKSSSSIAYPTAINIPGVGTIKPAELWSSWSSWSTEKPKVKGEVEIQESYEWWAAQCTKCGTNNPYHGKNQKCHKCGQSLANNKGLWKSVFYHYKDASGTKTIYGRSGGRYFDGKPYWGAKKVYRYRTRIK